MSEQQKTVLGTKALDYLKFCLSAGQTIIAAQTSSPLEAGSTWAFLPAECVDAASANPEWSLSSAIPSYAGRGNADEMLAQFVLSYLQTGHDHYVVFQDWLREPGSPWLLKRPCPFFTFGTEVYYFLSSSNTNLNPSYVIEVMRRGYSANSRQNAGILTAARNVGEIAWGQEITMDVQKALSNGVEHIIVEGFDGDREIVWSKQASIPPD